MTTITLVNKQHEIVQRSYRVMNDYERAKGDADARFKREKETAEAAGRVNSGATVEEIRKLAQSVQDSINTYNLQDKVIGGTPSFFPLLNNVTEITQQMAKCRSTAKDASNRMNAFLAKEKERANDQVDQRIINAGIAFVIGMAVLVLMASLLPSLNPTIYIILSITIMILSYFLLFRIQRRVYLNSDIKDDYATLIQMVPVSENIHKQLLLLAQQRSQNMLNECQTRYAATIKEINRKLADDLNALQLASNALVSDAGICGMTWGDSQWRQWQPSRTTNAIALTRLGTLNTDLHKELPTIPAYIACPGA